MKFETKFEIGDLVDVTNPNDWFHQYNPWKIETIYCYSPGSIHYVIRQTTSTASDTSAALAKVLEHEIARHEVKYSTFKEYLLSVNLEIKPNTCFYIWNNYDKKEVCVSVRRHLLPQGPDSHVRHDKFGEIFGHLMSQPFSRLNLPFIGEF